MKVQRILLIIIIIKSKSKRVTRKTLDMTVVDNDNGKKWKAKWDFSSLIHFFLLKFSVQYSVNVVIVIKNKVKKKKKKKRQEMRGKYIAFKFRSLIITAHIEDLKKHQIETLIVNLMHLDYIFFYMKIIIVRKLHLYFFILDAWSL